MECKYCSQQCNKAGRQLNGLQRYRCKSCKKYQQQTYHYSGCKAGVGKMIIKLLCNSVGILGISRVLSISATTVLKQIRQIADRIIKPAIPLKRASFEIDELRTYVLNKQNEYWVAYVLCSTTKEVVDFIVDKRSKRILRMIVNTALTSKVKQIKTDRLNIYQSLMPQYLHVGNAYSINYIERNILNLRTHLKCLGRRTICYSKSMVMLSACLKIYFWASDGTGTRL